MLERVIALVEQFAEPVLAVGIILFSIATLLFILGFFIVLILIIKDWRN